MQGSIAQLQDWIDQSQSIVFFGGAGVSTESGIPDFRSVDGLYHQRFAYPPETMLSASFFHQHTDLFFDFYRTKMIALEAKPNPAHLKLAQLEAQGKLKAVITQNIDGLHQMAGSQNVLELHGSVHRNYCTRCHQFHDLPALLATTGVPHCPCGGVMKPDVVLYEESLRGDVLEQSVDHLRQADLLIIGGTSLAVYPAASLIHYYRGNRLVLINKGATPMDAHADLVLNAPIGQVFSALG